MAKSIVETNTLLRKTISDGFHMHSLRSAALNPFMDVTYFSMSQPTFKPHPHAGFSAITYMTPESLGTFVNRDSLGDCSLIKPGHTHWTQAGSGMMHEEIPKYSGTDCIGFQIFLKLAKDDELSPPAAYHLSEAQTPHITGDNWEGRLITGHLNGQNGALNTLHADALLCDLNIQPNGIAELNVKDGLALWAVVRHGDVHIEQQPLGAVCYLIWGVPGQSIQLRAGPNGATILLGGGKPLSEPYVMGGPFALSNKSTLDNAFKRFRSGQMGDLKSSF